VSLKKEVTFYIVTFVLAILIVLSFIYRVINDIVIKQEITKANDISKTIYLYR